MDEVKKLVLMFFLPALLCLGDAGSPSTAVRINVTVTVTMISESSVKFMVTRVGIYNCTLENIGGLEMPRSTSLTRTVINGSFNELIPGTEYCIICVKANGRMTDPTLFTTSQAISVVNTTDTSVRFTLDSEEDLVYNCMLKKGEMKFSQNITVHDGEYVEFTELDPGTDYKIMCTLRKDPNRKSSLLITTLQVSSNVTNITTSATCDSIVVSWHSPITDGGAPIIDYNVHVLRANVTVTILNTTNTTVSVFQLEQNKKYTVRIIARNSVGLGPSAVRTVRTMRKGRGKLNITRIFHSNATILTNSLNPFNCTIEERQGGGDTSAIKEEIFSEATIQGLTPNTTFKIVCTAKNDTCVILNGMFTTLATVPSNPNNITLDLATCNSATISWIKPEDDGGSAVLGYTVTFANRPEMKLATQNTTLSLDRMVLLPSTLYTLYIRARNSAGLGSLTEFNFSTKGMREVSIVTDVSSYSINFTLSDTSQDYECLIMTVHGVLLTSSRITKENVGVFRSLQPNINYTIKCKGSENKCFFSSTSVRTRLGTPDPPVLYVPEQRKQCSSITLSWTPPNITGGEEILNYTVKYTSSKNKSHTLTVPGNQTSLTLNGLSSSTLYTIEIRSSNSELTGPAESTEQMTARRRQGSLIINERTDASFRLSHNLGPNIQYLCCSRDAESVSQPFNITKKGHVLPELKPDTSYTIECMAYKSGVDYCLDVNTTLKTLPGTVKDLAKIGLGRVVNGSIHQSIWWNKPAHHTSLLHYNISYALEDGVVYKTTNGTTFNLTFNLPTQMESYDVQVAVAVVSNAGQGEYKNITIEYKKPGKPKDIKVVNKTCNSVSLQWSPPNDTGGLPVLDYTIITNNSQDTLRSSAEQTDVVLSNFVPGRSYRIKVRAKNFIGGAAQAIPVTTENRMKFTLQFQSYSSTKAHLIINPTGKLKEDGIIYSCTLSPEAIAIRNTSEHNITFDNLTPATNYSVMCLAYSDSGEELCYEGIANGRTFPSVPEIAPINVTVTSTSSNHFTVEWNLPEEYIKNQDIEGYNVVYKERGSRDRENINVTVRSTVYKATDLIADKVYAFWVAAATANGIGKYSKKKEIATIPRVQNITISKILKRSAFIQWNRANPKYIIWFDLSVNDGYSYGNRFFTPVSLRNHTKWKVTNLDPFRSYTLNIYLQLKNRRGNGSTTQMTFTTLGTEPTESPSNLSVTPNKRNATLHWEIPPVSGRNGIIISYIIQWRSSNQQTSPVNHTVSQPTFTHPEHLSRTLGGLRPYTNYAWRVAAVNFNGRGNFSQWKGFTTDEDVPDRVENLAVNSSNASSIMVKWSPPSTPNGVIIAYSVCYWTLGEKCLQPINRSNPVDVEQSIHGLDPGIPYKVSVAAFTSAGQGEENTHDPIIFTVELPPNRTVSGIRVNWTSPTTVNVSWTPLTLFQARGFPIYKVVITSEGRTVKSDNTTDSHLSAEGLDQNTLYSVSVQPLTDGGKAVGKTSNSVNFGSPTTQSSFPVWIVIIVVLLILSILICLVIFIIIVLFRKYKRQQKEADLMEEVLSMKEVVAVVDDSIVAHHNMQRKEPIPKGLFCEHIRKMHHNKDDSFKAEFGDITKEPPVSKEASESNRQRNRYINIYPYDYSRVVLSDSDGSDYVNAAFLDGYKSPKRYIASQGPTPVTTADFWEMIWEQKTTVIVMLTRLVEGTRIKCEQYWNEEINATYEPGRNLRVTMTSNKVMTGFEVRQFRVEKTSTKSDPIKVKHFLYTAWPDHGVPQYTSSMVKFILHQYKPEVKDSTTPIVVHCSAGAGRTGTFVAIDTAIDRLAEEDDINIFECVELMRARRTQMVQNVSQYIYIHDAINDYVTCGETAIVAHELGQKKSEMKKTDPNTNKTGFEQLFKLLQETSAEVCDDDKEFSRRQDIAERNRYKTRYPYSDNFIQTEDDETYINATEIKGYYGQGTFIAAQAPMKNTIEDTWNVIRQQNCSVVVVLTNFEEQSQEMCAEFWPGEVGVPMEIGYMKISLTNTVHNEQFDEHKLSISVEEADIVNKVDVYHYKAWMKHNSPDVPSLLKLMGDVQRSHQGSSGPLMVMCDDGMSRTGVFITVMSEIDRVKVEGEMDIFHTVKAARTDRPHMVSTVGDYECCHEILQQYLESFDTYANFK